MTKRELLVIINMPRILIGYLFLIISNNQLLKMDFAKWKQVLFKEYESKSDLMNLGYYLIFKHEFRNIFYFRLKRSNIFMAVLFKVLFPLLDTLFIETSKIGGGLFIQHGFSTIIAAKSIGENFWCNQQVTIGFIGSDQPIIENNVSVFCGAKVLGNVTLKNGTRVGANAVVLKSSNENALLVGVPAKDKNKQNSLFIFLQE